MGLMRHGAGETILRERGKFLLIAREMHGETDAFQRLRCSDLQRR